MKLIPRNWAKFQHYKDRNPPWIKLHKELLNDRQYMRLPLASKALAPLLWLLASESSDGAFDASTEELQFRLHLSSKDIESGLKPLISNGFFVAADESIAEEKHVASTLLADRLHVATPETERETEKETKTDAPPGVSISVWEGFKKLRKAKKAPLTDTALQGIKREADKAGWPLEDALQECCVRGWQGFKAEWVQPRTQGKPQDDALVKIKEDAVLSRPMPDKVRSMLVNVVKRMP